MTNEEIKMENNCPICGTSGGIQLIKFNITYNLCPKCSGLYTLSRIPGELIITENDCNVARNQKEINLERLRRIEEKITPKMVLDFGCGQGEMKNLICCEKQYDAIGIDQGTEIQLRDCKPDDFNVIIMTEVIEHIYDPINLFNRLYNLLSSVGLIYIESSFNNYMKDLNESTYVDPRIGHCLVHSKESIEYLAKLTGFKTDWYSQNVVFFIKSI